MSTSEVWTIGRLLQWTTKHLRGHGVENPRLDAEVLLAHARRCERIDLYADFGEVADDDVRARFRDLVRRRTVGTPVAYLVGHREFYSLSFQVTKDVLIPRPETELLVVTVLDLARQRPPEQRLRILDVGTGSGNVAVAVAKHVVRASVTAVDVSPTALEIARQNAEQHGVVDRISFVQSDLMAEMPGGASWDVIVSNPPYVSDAEYGALSREIKDHEPRAALVAGPRGTEVIERLIGQSAQRLESGGWLLFEISPMIADSCRKLLTGARQWTEVEVIRDVSGTDRVVCARKQAAA